MKLIAYLTTFPVLLLSMSCAFPETDQGNGQSLGTTAHLEHEDLGTRSLQKLSEQDRAATVTIKDPQMNNMPAMAMEIPAGYQVNGGIQWVPRMGTSMPEAHLDIHHPVKGSRLTTFPGLIRHYVHSESLLQTQREAMQMGLDMRASFQQENVIPATLAMQGLLLPLVQQKRGQVQVVSEVEVVGLEEQLWPGQNKHNTPYVGRKMTITYQQAGQDITEELYGLYMQVKQASADGYVVTWGLDRVFGISAPGHHFDAVQQELLAIASSYKIMPAYEQAVGEVMSRRLHENNEMRRQQQRQSYAAHQQRMADRQASFDASQQAYRETQQVYDQQYQSWSQNQQIQFRSNQNVNDNIVGYQRYTDPNMGQERLLDNQYKYQWTDVWGNTHGSNDPSYDPNHHSDGTQYYQMQPVR